MLAPTSEPTESAILAPQLARARLEVAAVLWANRPLRKIYARKNQRSKAASDPILAGEVLPFVVRD